MAEENESALRQVGDTRAAQTVSSGGVDPPLTEGRIHPDKNSRDVCATRESALQSPPHKPWTLPSQGLALFHGDQSTARLSHYFLPRLLLEGKRVLMLDGANCADPRLLERLARQRRVPFAQFCRQIQIARAFTCFQLTELIARLPRLLADFPAQALIVTAFPELYYDEDVRDWNAQVAFEQALTNLRRWARSGDFTSGPPKLAAHVIAQHGSVRQLTDEPQSSALIVAVFSSATTFTPSPARKRFFEKVCAAGSEVWQFNSNAEGKLGLVCRKMWASGEHQTNWRTLTTPSPGSLRLVKTPAASHPLPQGGEGRNLHEGQ